MEGPLLDQIVHAVNYYNTHIATSSMSTIISMSILVNSYLQFLVGRQKPSTICSNFTILLAQSKLNSVQVQL